MNKTRQHTHRQQWKSVAVAFAMAALFCGCYRPIPTETPIIPREQMIPVLKDIHLAEALLVEIQDNRAKDSIARLYYAQIYAIHRIDPLDFEQSYNAYVGDPHALDSLYRDVIQALDTERNKLKTQSEQGTPEMDPVDERR